MPAQRSVVSSAKLIAVCTLLSRITGLVRDVLLARAFGLAWVQDAWIYAFQVPNLFRRLFGEGAMAAAFVPSFTTTLERDGKPAAWGLLARTLALLTVALSAVILLIGLVLVLVWALVPASPQDASERWLLLSLTGLMLPFMLTICVVALFSSILNCVGSFVPAALMPVLLNVCMIIGIGWLAPGIFPGEDRAQVYVVGATVVTAGILQVLIMIPMLRAYGVRLGWRLDTHDPTLRRMLTLVVPVLIGQGVLAFGVYLDAQICIAFTRTSADGVAAAAGTDGWRPLQEGALGAVTYAQRLYQFPLGVLVLSLATAALPTFSRLAGREEWTQWGGEVSQALRLAIFEGVLAGAMMVVLAEPIVRLLFEYGDFGAADTARVGNILPLYGLGLWAFCAQHIVLRAFYSLGDVRTPLRISAGLLLVSTAMNLTLIWLPPVREAAFAISTSVSASLAVAIGVALLHRKVYGALNLRTLRGSVWRVVVAGTASASLVAWIAPHWSAWTSRSFDGVAWRAVEALGMLTLGCGVFIGVAAVLRLEEVRWLLGSARRATPSDGAGNA